MIREYLLVSIRSWAMYISTKHREIHSKSPEIAFTVVSYPISLIIVAVYTILATFMLPIHVGNWYISNAVLMDGFWWHQPYTDMDMLLINSIGWGIFLTALYAVICWVSINGMRPPRSLKLLWKLWAWYNAIKTILEHTGLLLIMFTRLKVRIVLR